MEEIWKDIPGYEGRYQASVFGYIRSKNRIVKKGKKRVDTSIKGVIIAPYIPEDGYLRVSLYKNGHKRNEKVHSLVARTFIPNPENKKTVNHIDENKLNNTVENLEWMTNSENVNYGTRVQRLKEKYGYRIKRISPSRKEEYYSSLHDVEEKTGIPRQSVSYAIKHHTKLKGFEWEVVN